MTEEAFVMEMCGNKSAWQIAVNGITKINLEAVGKRIENAGYTIGIQNRLAWTFSGPADLTLYPSGKLLVKTENKELAATIAENHVKVWVRA